MKLRLSVVGLGKLGAPMLAVFAHKGSEVIGVDVNPALVAAINAGRAAVAEPALQRANRGKPPSLPRDNRCE